MKKLVSLLDKTNGEVIQKRPRCLTKGQTALVDIQLPHAICVEPYRVSRELGRFMLRAGGRTIAGGIVESIRD